MIGSITILLSIYIITITSYQVTAQPLLGIRVGLKPTAVAVNPNTNMVYVANSYSNTLSVINGSTNSVATNITLDSSPFSLAVNPNTNMVYVAENDSITVSVIDGKTNSLVNAIPLDGLPNNIVVNNKTNMIYVTTETYYTFSEINEKIIPKGNNTLTVINGNTNTINETFFLDVPLLDVAVNPNTNMVYVTNQGNNSISVINFSIINTTTNNVLGNITLGHFFTPSSIGVDLQTDTVYIANNDANRVSVIDGKTNSLVKNIVTGNYSSGESGLYQSSNSSVVAVNPNTNMVYVTERDSNRVSVIDGKTNSLVKSIVTDNTHYDISVNPLTNMIYTTNRDSNTVSVIDGDTNSIAVGSVSDGRPTENSTLENGLKIGGNPFDVAVNPNTNMVYVIDKFSKKISFLDGDTDEIIKTIVVATSDLYRSDIRGNIDLRSAIAVNPNANLLYTISTDSNIISVIDGSEGSIITNNTVEGSPFDIAFNPDSERIYVTTNKIDNTSSINGTVYDLSGYFNRVENSLTKNDFLSTIAYNPNTKIIYVNTAYSDRIYALDDTLYELEANITIGKNSIPYDVAVNPNTNMVYVTEYYGGDGRVYVIDEYTQNVTEIPLGTGTRGVAVNPNTNMVYVANIVSNTLSVINGSTNIVMDNIPVGRWPHAVAVNPNTNMVYVANTESGTVSIINGHTNKLTAGVKFNVNPSNSGFIECNRQKVLSNYSRYDIGTQLKCEAKANTGFQFSSWSSNFHLNNPRSISTVFDFMYIYWFGGLPSNLNNDPNLNNIPLTNFIVSKYGELNANFVEPPVTIPPEVWTPLYGLIPGFFIPSIISWLNGRRQRGYLKQYMRKIGKEDKSTMEKEITELYTNGKISESHNQMLKDKMSEYYNDVNKSPQGSPIK